MSQFIETICFESGKYHLLELHQSRMERTFGVFFPGTKPFQLEEILPPLHSPRKHKVRVTYDHSGYSLQQQVYCKKAISSVQVVETSLDYSYKFAYRDELNKLLSKAGTSEILLSRHGVLTDASYCNIVLYDGTEWLTPEYPLLHGIKREHLLAEGRIRTATINVSDLANFACIGFINAMLNVEDLNYRMEDLEFKLGPGFISDD